MTSTRLLDPADAPALLEIAREDSAFFAPWEPLHDEHWLTEAAQLEVIGEKLEQHRLGLACRTWCSTTPVTWSGGSR